MIGWISSGLLLITFGSQTYIQWEKKSADEGPYIFIFFAAAILGTAGNLIYSWIVLCHFERLTRLGVGADECEPALLAQITS